MNDIHERIRCKLSDVDAIRFSTLSKNLYGSYKRTHVLANLMVPSDVDSFEKWMARFGHHVARVHIKSVEQRSPYIPLWCHDALEEGTFEILSVNPAIFHKFPRLRVLSLTVTGYDDMHFTQKSLEKLEVFARHGAPHISFSNDLSNLTSLVLSKATITDLPEFPRLLELGIPTCQVSDQVIERLADLTTLTSLDISGCCLTHIPTEISRLVHLEKLTASRNNLSCYDNGIFYDDTLQALERLPNLQHLDISHNYIDSTGIENALPRLWCQNLQTLDLSCNPCVDMPYGPYLKSVRTLRCSFVPTILRYMSLSELRLHGYCTRHDPRIHHDLLAHAIGPQTGLSLKRIVFDDSHICAKLMNDVLYLVKLNPGIETFFPL